MPQRQLILASSSPYRLELLTKLGLPFVVESPQIDESCQPGEKAAELVERLATTKARTVAERHTSSLVIGSDQVAVLGGKIIGKPSDHEDAVRQLQQASASTMRLYTGLALIDSDSLRCRSCVETFDVVFRQLEQSTIKRYLEIEQPYNCCGSLRAEGLGIALLAKLSGDDPNALIGLPLIALVGMLQQEGISVPA